MIQIVFSFPKIHSNLQQPPPPPLLQIVLLLMAKHGWKAKEKIPEFPNFQWSVPKFEFHATFLRSRVVPLSSTSTLCIYLYVSHLVISYLAEWMVMQCFCSSDPCHVRVPSCQQGSCKCTEGKGEEKGEEEGGRSRGRGGGVFPFDENTEILRGRTRFCQDSES